MKKLFSIFVLAAAALSATPATTELTLVDAGSPQISDGAYYVGPYTVSVDRQSYAALCVDFLHDSYLGAKWTTYVNTTSDYSKLYHADNPTAYLEEAYLYNLITQPGADRMDIQHAAWNITDSSYAINAAAQSFVQLAQENYNSVNTAGFEVLSDVNGRQQEFMIFNPSAAAPEPGSFVMLGGGLLFGLGLIRRNRKKA